MGPEIVIFCMMLTATQSPEVLSAIDAQYGVGPQAERFVRQNTMADMWRIGAKAGPVFQIAVTRRVAFEYRF